MEEKHVLPFINPGTGENFGEVRINTPQEVHQAMRKMRALGKLWGDRPVGDRVRVLQQFQQIMLAAADEITAVINQATGKSRQDALVEVFMTVEMMHYYLKQAPKWLRRQQIPRGLFFFKRLYMEYSPFGVVAVLSPWNYPFALAMQPVLSALLAGNVVLLKPSEVTPAVGALIESLFSRVPGLAPYVRVLHGGGETGAALVEASPDFIFLTGSPATGQKVMAAAASKLTPLLFELGGKDAMIVLEDADVTAAARWGVWAAHFNAGQSCVSVERAYVVKDVYDEFVRRVVSETRSLSVGYSQDINNSYYLGPVTDRRQLNIIQNHLDDAIGKGARVLAGGQKEGNYFVPTVLVDVDHSMLLMREETFGPLFPIMKVEDEQEAVRLANDSTFGLGASIWSRDIERARKVAHQLDAGSVIINDTMAQFAMPLLPFGGMKQSGFGRAHGKEGLLAFTQPQSFVEGNPPYPWDIATIARKPGSYLILSGIMHLVYGVGLRQRLQPLRSAWKKLRQEPVPASPRLAFLAGEQLTEKKKVPPISLGRLGVRILLGLSGALLGGLLIVRRNKS